jgi:hypothetical protein
MRERRGCNHAAQSKGRAARKTLQDRLKLSPLEIPKFGDVTVGKHKSNFQDSSPSSLPLRKNEPRADLTPSSIFEELNVMGVEFG